MIKIQYGELNFSCDSAAEAAEIAKLICDSPRQLSPYETAGNKANPVITNTTSGSSARTPAADEVNTALQALGSLPDTAVSSGSLARTLGIKSVNGLGPRLAGLSNRIYSTYGCRVDLFLYKDARAGQPTTWKLDREKYQQAIKGAFR